LEYAQFSAKTGVFADSSRSHAWELLQQIEMDGITFWKGFFADTYLAKVYSALRVLKVTSAANERDWSIRGFIHSKIRNRYFTQSHGAAYRLVFKPLLYHILQRF
jgi:hypothetical protein